MRNGRQRGHSVYGLLTLLLFSVFAGCVLTVLLSGADTYQRLVARDENAFCQRTCVQYISNRLRQLPLTGEAEVTDFYGESCLVLPETIGGERYLTRVYRWDGWIRELFTPEQGSYLPEQGERLIEAKGLTFQREGSLLSVHLVDGEGRTLHWLLSLNRGREGCP